MGKLDIDPTDRLSSPDLKDLNAFHTCGFPCCEKWVFLKTKKNPTVLVQQSQYHINVRLIHMFVPDLYKRYKSFYE